MGLLEWWEKQNKSAWSEVLGDLLMKRQWACQAQALRQFSGPPDEGNLPEVTARVGAREGVGRGSQKVTQIASDASPIKMTLGQVEINLGSKAF